MVKLLSGPSKTEKISLIFLSAPTPNLILGFLDMVEKRLNYEDEVLLRMLKTPPKPHAQMKARKAKASPTKKKRASAKTSKASDAS